jgi:DNA-binding Lrp family transcriptional regulator
MTNTVSQIDRVIEVNPMKRKDLLILSCLRQHGRESLTNISKETKVPISTIFEKLRYQYSPIIKRSTLLIDFSQLGFLTVAHVAFRLEKGDRNTFREHVSKHPHVNSVYRINNGYDYLCECVFRNIKELEEFIEKLEENFQILDKNVYYIIEEIRKEVFLADPTLIDLIFRSP